MNCSIDRFQGQVGPWISEIESLLHKGGSLLHKAVQENAITEVKVLLDKGVYINAHNLESDQTLLHVAARSSSLMIVDMLVKNGAVLGARDRRGTTPLHCAVQEGSNDIVIYLIKAGSDINARTWQPCGPDGGDTPLHLAVRYNKIDNIKTLILAGADTTIKNRRKEHPIDLECSPETKRAYENAIHEKNERGLQ